MTESIKALLRGVHQVVSEQELRSKLAKGKPLRIKLGVDPTAPDLHLGHTVTLNKLRQFQDQGHVVVFIIGDFTALIGDPSGRSETRPPMTVQDVEKNARTYLDQVFRILDKKKTEVVKNSEWLRPLFGPQDGKTGPHGDIFRILARHTVQQLTEREDFSNRLKEGSPITLLELFYPLMQGYDSVAVKADVEIGGTDQLFNLLMGREMQKDSGQETQVVMTLPLLEGTDGVRKMSKSYGNYIALTDAPSDMFGKVMSISDDLMWKYYELLTDVSLDEAKSVHPMEAKKRLAGLLVARYHGTEQALNARTVFEKTFSKRETPDELKEYRVSRATVDLVDLLIESGMAPSKNEARRLLTQGAVEVAGERIAENRSLTIHSPLLVKVGKRQFRKILPAE